MQPTSTAAFYRELLTRPARTGAILLLGAGADVVVEERLLTEA